MTNISVDFKSVATREWVSEARCECKAMSQEAQVKVSPEAMERTQTVYTWRGSSVIEKTSNYFDLLQSPKRSSRLSTRESST